MKVFLCFLVLTFGEANILLSQDPAVTPEPNPTSWKDDWKNMLDVSSYTPQQKRALDREVQKNNEAAAGWWKTPIEFFGKVVDQQGNPVSKMAIRLRVSDESAAGTTVYETTSDVNGRFNLRNKTGKSMEVELASRDYYLSRKNPRSFEFADSSQKNFTESSLRDPVVFVALKRTISAPLIKGKGQWDLSFDGKPLYLDLVNSDLITRVKRFEEADLVVSYNREESKNGEKPNWTLTLEVPGKTGGLLQTHDEFMFTAPVEGYQSKLVLDKNCFKEPGGAVNGAIYLYLCSREGKNYARLKMSFIGLVRRADIDPKTGLGLTMGELTLNYYLNPMSSPNLEYEYGNRIKIKTLADKSRQLIFPTPEDLEEARKELYTPKYNPFNDEIIRTYDFFP